MGRIVATVDIENFSETGSSMKLDALVDTGASYLTLPPHWKSRFGALPQAGPGKIYGREIEQNDLNEEMSWLFQ